MTIHAQRLSGQRSLRVEMLDSWHVGSGRGSGPYLDAMIERDAEGLPFVPGRMLRGLLRDACECLAHWGHVERQSVIDVFGSIVPSSDTPGRSVSRAGGLAVSSARLSPALRQQLRNEAGLRTALTMDSFQTALNPATGAAKKNTLRGFELAVPLTLEATLEVWGSSADRMKAAWDLIELAVPLVTSLGAHKSRGHGRARLTLLNGARA